MKVFSGMEGISRLRAWGRGSLQQQWMLLFPLWTVQEKVAPGVWRFLALLCWKKRKEKNYRTSFPGKYMQIAM